MEKKNPSDLPVEGLLRVLGVELFCQWDLLVFLYRHQTSLVSADYIARLVGHLAFEVGEALDHLESLGFVIRSRVDRGVRLYQFALPEDPRRGAALDRLMTLGDHRGGRLLLAKHLRHGNQRAGTTVRPVGERKEVRYG